MWVWVSKLGKVYRENGLWEKVGNMGTSGNKEYQFTARSVMNDFTVDVVTTPAGILFQNGSAQTLKAYWRRRIQHLCWWNWIYRRDLVVLCGFNECRFTPWRAAENPGWSLTWLLFTNIRWFIRRIAGAVRQLLQTGHADALSQTSFSTISNATAPQDSMGWDAGRMKFYTRRYWS